MTGNQDSHHTNRGFRASTGAAHTHGPGRAPCALDTHRLRSAAMPSFLSQHPRTHMCGELRSTDVGRKVTLFGWVWTRRDHGGCVFVDLRDRTGVTQVMFSPDVDAEAHGLAGELRSEFC